MSGFKEIPRDYSALRTAALKNGMSSVRRAPTMEEKTKLETFKDDLVYAFGKGAQFNAMSGEILFKDDPQKVKMPTSNYYEYNEETKRYENVHRKDDYYDGSALEELAGQYNAVDRTVLDDIAVAETNDKMNMIHRVATEGKYTIDPKACVKLGVQDGTRMQEFPPYTGPTEGMVSIIDDSPSLPKVRHGRRRSSSFSSTSPTNMR